MIINILNDKQKEELLKLFENKVNVPKDLDINPLGLMHEVAKALLNFEAYHNLNDDIKEELKFSMKDNLIDCLDTEHFIYFIDAIDYLKEEDPSLYQSLEIAKEFSITNLSSTTLANLLYNQKQIELIDKIDFELIIETILKNQ
jgi:hypothetical protein